MAKAIEIATRMAESSAAKDTAQISQSFIPSPPPSNVAGKYGERHVPLPSSTSSTGSSTSGSGATAAALTQPSTTAFSCYKPEGLPPTKCNRHGQGVYSRNMVASGS